MADGSVPRQKRVGNYFIPERIKAIYPELAQKYAAGQSAKSLGREYGISKNTVLNAAAKRGIPLLGKAEAGGLLRTRQPTVPTLSEADTSLAHQVALSMGYTSSKGLSSDREFRPLVHARQGGEIPIFTGPRKPDARSIGTGFPLEQTGRRSITSTRWRLTSDLMWITSFPYKVTASAGYTSRRIFNL